MNDCPCGSKGCAHNFDLLLEGQARKFLREYRGQEGWWTSWSNPKHPNFKGEAYMARLRAKIQELKQEAK